jgi:hypothetical protein
VRTQPPLKAIVYLAWLALSASESSDEAIARLRVIRDEKIRDQSIMLIEYLRKVTA